MTSICKGMQGDKNNQPTINEGSSKQVKWLDAHLAHSWTNVLKECQISLQLLNVFAVNRYVVLPVKQAVKNPSRSKEYIVVLMLCNPSYTRVYTPPLSR